MALHILALETSSACCGVALLRREHGTPDRLWLREQPGVQEHSARLLPMVDALLAEAGLARTDLDAIAFGQGPGGFTGLRVACGVAQGMAFALDRPVLPVVTHAAVAAQVSGERDVVVALDARMHEIFLAAYRPAAGGWQCLLPPCLVAAQGVGQWLRQGGLDTGATPFVVVGDGLAAYPEAFEGLRDDEQGPVAPVSALAVARLGADAYLRGERLAPDAAVPLYVRDKVAFTTAERAQGAGGNPRVQPLTGVCP